ncbi:alpha/beta fold hydrolase [Nocardia sp. NPDC004068]|uniref:alpha/beta fold hydrolase n=1 Tax=Nocardia sp. NPDC004068 TaxID=3364303 RepID=UPI0036AD77AD
MREAAVVLVHGLFSSAATWSELESRIGEDVVLGWRFDVFHLSYDSPKFRLSPLRGIPDYDAVADDLATYLDVEVGGYDSVVLVSHSQGGLILQRYLARMVIAGRGRDLARIKAVVMFACPNSGSELGILLRRSAVFWHHPQERQLRPINDQVIETQRIVLQRIQYARTVDAQNCPIPIFPYAGTSDNVVTPASARGVFPEARALPGDHFSIIKAPTPSARAFTALRSHLLAALREKTARAGADAVPARHNLTTPPEVFLDRTHEMGRVLDGLRSKRRMVSISGLGGMGKSALAHRVAWRCATTEGQSGESPCFDAIVWCDRVVDAHSVDTLIDTVSKVMGYPHIRALSMPDKIERALECINRERCLLVLDDFEETDNRSVLEFVGRLNPDKTKVLVTSRRRYTGEVWSVDLGGLDERARRDLLVEEGHRLGLASIARGAAVTDYLNATGGNPLAIKLTVGQISYGDEFNAVTTSLRRAADRALFETIFERSWRNMLAEDDTTEAIVACVALHPAPVSREAIEAAVGVHGETVARAIRKVVDASLLDVVRAGLTTAGRYTLHPLTRAYVRHRLGLDSGRLRHIEARLIRFYRDRAIEHSDISTRSDRVRVLEADRENITGFAELAFARASGMNVREHYRDVIRIAEAMAEFLWGRGYWRDRLRLCEIAGAAAEALGDPVALSRQYALMGRVYVWLGDTVEATRYLELSERALPPRASDVERRPTVRLRAYVASSAGDFSTARALLEEILDSAPLSADDEGRAATLVELGVCAVQEGDIEQAVAVFEEARRLDEAMGAVEGLAVSLSHLAEALFDSGRRGEARPLFEQGLELAHRVNRASTRGRCQLGLAKLYVTEGRLAEAARLAAAAAETYALLDMTGSVADARLILDNLSSKGLGPPPNRPTVAGSLSNCRAVLFDFDDTIAATMRSRWPVLRSTAASFGVDLSPATIRAAWGLPFDLLIERIVPTIDRATFVSRYREAMTRRPPMVTPGAEAALQSLRGRGIALSIVGSGSRSLIVQDLEVLGLRTYFDSIQGQEQSAVHKPDPRALHPAITALNERGIASDEIIYVGDSVRDLRAAAGNELRFIAVLTGLDRREDFLRAGLAENMILERLNQLALWL